MNLKPKRPVMITIQIDQNATDAEVEQLMHNLQTSDTVFTWTPGYRGRVVDYGEAIKLSGNKQW